MNRLAQSIHKHPVVAFFVLTYALAWIIWIPVGIFMNGISTGFVLLGAWAPTIAAITLTGYLEGRSGIGTLLQRIRIWRVGIQWYVFVLFSAALIGLVAIFLFILLGGTAPQPTFPPGVPRELGFVLLPIIFLTNIFVGGPLAEEYGWRGFALPHLQAKMSALLASLIIGIFWAVWHLPFFVFEATSSVVGNIPPFAYVLLLVGWSVLFTWVYNNSRGSILLMVLYHAALNTTIGSLGLIRTSTDGTTLLILYIILTWLIAMLVTAICGVSHLSPQKLTSDRNAAKQSKCRGREELVFNC